MFPVRREYHFTLDGESYLLVGWSRAADRRIRAEYAMGIAAAPAVLDALDGADLYAEAVARECLKEAPEFFWETLPASGATNGTPPRVLTFENVPLDLWDAFRHEVDTFIGFFRPAAPPLVALAADPGEARPDAVAVAETVPTRPRGRAE